MDFFTRKRLNGAVFSRRVFNLLAALVVAALLLPVYAGATVGIAGGPLYAIAAGTDSDETVYAATGTGLYASILGRDIWKPASTGIPSQDVYAVLLPPGGSAIYCATGDGIFQRSGPGEAWAGAGLKGSPAYSLAIHPVTATWLAAGTDEGVYATPDAGATWAKAAGSPPFVYDFASAPAQPSTLHAASFTDGVYTSADFGATWVKTGAGPEKAYCVAVRPDAPAVLFAGTAAGLYKSSNGGASWVFVEAAFSSHAVYRIAIDAAPPVTVYAATDAGIYKSIDGGNFWFAAYAGITREAGQGPFVREIAIDPGNSQRLYAGTYSGTGTDVRIYRSTNGGFSWTQINRTLATTTVTSLAFDPEDTQTVYAGTTTLGVLKSTNGGLSWEEANEGLLDTLVRAVAVAPQSASIYAGTTVGLFRSSDAGQLWEPASPRYDIYCIGIAPDGIDSLYVGTNQGIFASLDRGASWRSLNNNLVNPIVSSFAFDTADSDTVYVGTRGAGVFKTLDGGQFWYAADAGLENRRVMALAASPVYGNELYAGTDGGGVYKSINGGWMWESTGPDEDATAVNALAVNPAGPDILYAGTSGKGLFRSADGGNTWDSAGPAPAATTVYDVVVDPETPQTVLLAVEGAVVRLLFNSAPDIPSLPSPADGAVSQALTATLSWTCTDPDPGDRISYAVYFGTDPFPESKPPAIATAPAYDPGPLQLGQTYFWRVAATDAAGATTRGDIWQFSTLPSNPPFAPATPSPPDGAASQPCFLTLSWTGGDPDEGDTVSYDVYFGTQNPPRLVQRNLSGTLYAANYLRPLATYYWQVVARDSSAVETPGAVWSFTTGLLPQECLVETVLGKEHPGLADLREVRDRLLATSAAGRELIRLYYVLSPSLSRIARSSPAIKALSAELVSQVLAHERGNVRLLLIPETRDELLSGVYTLLEAYAGEADPATQTLLRCGWKALREFLETARP